MGQAGMKIYQSILIDLMQQSLSTYTRTHIKQRKQNMMSTRLNTFTQQKAA